MIRLSIILPIYNISSKSFRSLQSLMQQVAQGLEIIIVDDGSIDDSFDVVENIIKSDDRVKLIQTSENKGVLEARLEGLRHSKGDWVGFLDADDIALPLMLDRMLVMADKYNPDIVICQSDRVSEDYEFISHKIKFEKSYLCETKIFESFCNYGFGTPVLWNKLYRREIISEWANIEMPWRQDVDEDFLVNIGAFQKAKSVYVLAETHHNYVLSDYGITTTISKHEAFKQIFRSFSLAMSMYSNLSDSEISMIIEVYRRKLSGSECVVNNINDLPDYFSSLNESVLLVQKTRPYALALLAARANIIDVGGFLAIGILINSFKRKFAEFRARAISMFASKKV